ncbi:hypothetical protein D3C73_999970 [compost metagenome]
MDARQLGFFKIAFHVEAAGVHQGHHAVACRGVGPRAQIQVGDAAIAGGHHAAALQVQAGGVQLHLCLRQRGFGLLHLGLALLDRFCGHQLAQRTVALGVTQRLVVRHLLRSHRCLGLVERQLEAGAVDFKQQVAGLHVLVVVHGHARYQAGDVGRHLHHIGLDAAIARPGFNFIVHPKLPAGVSGGGDDDGRHRELADSSRAKGVGEFHTYLCRK